MGSQVLAVIFVVLVAAAQLMMIPSAAALGLQDYQPAASVPAAAHVWGRAPINARDAPSNTGADAPAVQANSVASAGAGNAVQQQSAAVTVPSSVSASSSSPTPDLISAKVVVQQDTTLPNSAVFDATMHLGTNLGTWVGTVGLQDRALRAQTIASGVC